MNSTKSYPRHTYWLHAVVSYVIVAVLVFYLQGQIGQYGMLGYLIVIFYWLYIEYKRIHDANKSAWFLLLNLIPGLGMFIALIAIGAMPSDYVNNKWYPDANNSENDSTKIVV